MVPTNAGTPILTVIKALSSPTSTAAASATNTAGIYQFGLAFAIIAPRTAAEKPAVAPMDKSKFPVVSSIISPSAIMPCIDAVDKIDVIPKEEKTFGFNT